MKRPVLIAGCMIVLTALPAFAKEAHRLERGDRLRVHTDEASVLCTLQSVGLDTIHALGRDGTSPIHFLTGDVRKIDVRVPRSQTIGMLRGAVIGGGLLGTIGLVYAIATSGDVDPCGTNPVGEICNSGFRAWRAIGYTFAFGAPGMLIGGIIGAAAPGERWQRIDVPGRLSLRPHSDGRVYLEYSLRF
jgi:hypothetical protein